MLDRIPNVPPTISPVPENGVVRPLWSVMIPAYNCIKYLGETLRSVLMQDQGLDLMQIEVVDDCSNDGDVEALVNEIGKGRIMYFKQAQNAGSLRNFETCLKRAKGHWVHMLHGDDRVAPRFYDEIKLLFLAHPNAGAAFTNFAYINGNSDIVDIVNPILRRTPGVIADFLLKIAHRQLIQPPAIVVKRSVYESIGSFYAVHYGEDWEMWARIASRYSVAYSPKCLAFYRVGYNAGISHNSFISGQNTKDIIKVIDIIQNYLPLSEREKLKKQALVYYSIFSIKVANSLLLTNVDAAFIQAKAAFKMQKSVRTYYWAYRFYLMHFLKFKKIQKLAQGKEHSQGR
jgi:glycosyltransferase involved in cell wall biosynthesis